RPPAHPPAALPRYHKLTHPDRVRSWRPTAFAPFEGHLSLAAPNTVTTVLCWAAFTHGSVVWTCEGSCRKHLGWSKEGWSVLTRESMRVCCVTRGDAHAECENAAAECPQALHARCPPTVPLCGGGCVRLGKRSRGMGLPIDHGYGGAWPCGVSQGLRSIQQVRGVASTDVRSAANEEGETETTTGKSMSDVANV
ncbi:hypothetical protein BD779DRAFT_1510506, partial [Infundibulicybe gibba]